MLNRRGFLGALAAVGCVLAADAIPELKEYPEFKYSIGWSNDKMAYLHAIESKKGLTNFHVCRYSYEEIPDDDFFKDIFIQIKIAQDDIVPLKEIN